MPRRRWRRPCRPAATASGFTCPPSPDPSGPPTKAIGLLTLVGARSPMDWRKHDVPPIDWSGVAPCLETRRLERRRARCARVFHRRKTHYQSRLSRRSAAPTSKTAAASARRCTALTWVEGRLYCALSNPAEKMPPADDLEPPHLDDRAR